MFQRVFKTVYVVGIVTFPHSKWKTSVLHRHTSHIIGGPPSSSGDSCTVGNVPVISDKTKYNIIYDNALNRTIY